MNKKHILWFVLGTVGVIIIGLGLGLVLFYLNGDRDEQRGQKVTITGTVADITDTPLPGQSVQLSSGTDNFSVAADSEGNFTFPNVPVGAYILSSGYGGTDANSETQLEDIIVSENGQHFAINIPVLTGEFDFMPPTEEKDVITRKDGTPAIKNELVIRWTEDATGTERTALEAKHKLTLVADTPEILLSTFTTKADVDETIAKINKESKVVAAIPSYILGENVIPKDPDYASAKNNWWLKKINAEPAWEIELGRSSTLVGVVDAGFDFKHPDLGGTFTVARANYSNEDLKISNNHGTHVSGIIAMQLNNDRGMTGIAPRTRIVPAKTHSMARVADAFRFFARCPSVKVISISMGNNWWSTNAWRAQNNLPALTAAEKKKISDDIDVILAPAVTLLAQKDKLIVHSAGNDAGDATLNTLNFDSVVTVAATDTTDALANFSNKGPRVDIAAPGKDIYSTITDKYDYMSGTSMATPLVAGVAALIRAERPALTAAQVKEILTDTAEPAAALAAESFGRVDAWRALLKATHQMGVEGTVYDEDTGAVVAKADVTDDASTGVTADKDGFYQIAALPWRTVELRAFAGDLEDKQTVSAPQFDVVQSLIDFELKKEEEKDTNANNNTNSADEGSENENVNADDDSEDEESNGNVNADDDGTTDENGNKLLDNGIVVSSSGCAIGGYPDLPPAEGDCPEGFYFSRETIACEQKTCPEGVGRTYTLECKCPEGTSALYICNKPGYVVACVANKP
ncbi:MAG: hypothetical protein A3F54_04240 [Candidatus Kerfeldbacteria bacterium RIFCSPHIGHO2_12_FULL_48_17]|uniref:Peptidase S8/S53 domain-containing protein n=1 Tax=Candidatus Kerfeldbacteria bacterium RIFCSPHIGHO2_12_FULL_48_17 TaxID=1798542 RepID=A0A1G2B9Q0_9BACT|nr:MAG: hypothetical protein A3F54_04240 [Candidatus Kerfeldbacteria bacterium RIFCSPHIGHO2_12_FULL_48_17]